MVALLFAECILCSVGVLSIDWTGTYSNAACCASLKRSWMTTRTRCGPSSVTRKCVVGASPASEKASSRAGYVCKKVSDFIGQES